MDGQAGFGAGGGQKQLDSQEEPGNGGVALGPVEETAHRLSRDKVWRQLDRQEWISNLLLVCGKGGALLLILSWIPEFA